MQGHMEMRMGDKGHCYGYIIKLCATFSLWCYNWLCTV